MEVVKFRMTRWMCMESYKVSNKRQGHNQSISAPLTRQSTIPVTYVLYMSNCPHIRAKEALYLNK